MKKNVLKEILTGDSNTFPALWHRKTGCYKLCSGGKSDFSLSSSNFITNNFKEQQCSPQLNLKSGGCDDKQSLKTECSQIGSEIENNKAVSFSFSLRSRLSLS